MRKLNESLAKSNIATINAAQGVVDIMPIIQQLEGVLDDYNKRKNTEELEYEAAYEVLYALAKAKYKEITKKDYMRVINVSELDAKAKRIA